jgi:hypothetical protein
MTKQKRGSVNDKEVNPNEKELVAIKRLLILLLLKLGAKNEEIGVALQLDRTTIGKWFKDIEIEKISLNK